MEQEFTEFSKFRESNKSMKHELGYNLKILSLTCVLLAAMVASCCITQEVAEWQFQALLL